MLTAQNSVKKYINKVNLQITFVNLLSYLIHLIKVIIVIPNTKLYIAGHCVL